ncbi:MAG: ATP-binding protein [Solirubrobacterales bacterium]
MESLWFVDQMVEGGEALAEQVHTETSHGLQELVQNADDHGATELRISYRKTARETQLLVAHDGKPVDLRDVYLTAYALASGSRDDPEKIGRFGIGLKTLTQISEGMSVHCPPFDGVAISGGRIRSAPAPAPIRGFWSPEEHQTMFVLRLKPDAPDKKFFRQWLSGWDASSLLFLRTLRHVAFVDYRSRRVLAQQRLEVQRGPSKTKLDIRGGEEAERVVLRDARGGRRWTRYTVRYPVPRDLRRANKATGETIPLSVAIPETGPTGGRLFAIPAARRGLSAAILDGRTVRHKRLSHRDTRGVQRLQPLASRSPR